MALIDKEQEYQDQEAWSKDIEKLKGYKELKEKVEYWVKLKYIIQGPYEILWDDELGWCVDVDGYVSFSYLTITEIPFQFRNVNVYFSCSCCRNLTSLKGCPIYVGTNFNCAYCKKLTFLEGCPKEVGGQFRCNDCCNKFTKKYIQSLCNVKGNIIT